MSACSDASVGAPNAAAAATLSPEREAAFSSSSSQGPLDGLFGGGGSSDGSPCGAIGKSVSTEIAELKAEQAKLRAERAKVAKSLRNAEKRKQRLKTKAKALTDADLVTVLQMRKEKIAAKSSA